ncbi:MAG: PAS domain S-box protein [Pseudanabaenaceae cyanobacterium]
MVSGVPPMWEAARVCVGQMRLSGEGFGEWLYLSPACLEVTGCTPSALQTDAAVWPSRIHPDDWVSVVKPALPVVRRGQSVAIAYRFRHGSGEWCWLQQTWIPVGSDVCAVVTQDLGKPEALQPQQASWERGVQAIVEAAADGLLVVDTEGYVMYANPTAQALWQGNLTGKIWGMPLASAEVELVLPGRIRYADMRVSPIVWGDRPAHLITLRDITDRHRVEQDLQARVQREQASLQVTRAIRSSFHLKQIFDTATAEIGRLLGVDIVHVTRYLPQEQRWQHVSEYRAATHLPSFLNDTIPNANNPIATQLVKGCTVNIADTSTVTDPLHAHLPGGSWLVVPLEVEGRVWGSLSCRYYDKPHLWQLDEVDLVNRLGDQLAIAIQQAELYARVQQELAHSQAIAQTLQKQERLFRGIVENVGEVIFVLDPQGQFTYVSPSWQTVVGHAPATVLGRHFAEFVHPEDLGICTAAFAQLQQQERIGLKVGPYRVQQADGSYRRYETSISSVLDDQGEFLQAVGVARDVEDRERYAQDLRHAKEVAEANSRELREREALFQGIVKNAGEAIVIVDAQGCFAYVSPSWATVTGYEPDAVLGQHFREFVHPDDLDITMTALAQMQAQECAGRKVGPYRWRRPDGSYRWHEGSASSLFDDRGRLLQIVGVIRDVEDQQQYAQALQRAKEAAEANSRAKSDFLAVMSHELRTPMNAVLGFAQLLLATPLTAEQQEYVNAILDGGKLLVEVISDVLDLSRAEANRLELAAEPFDLRSAVADVVRLLQPTAIAKHLKLSHHVTANLPARVIGDVTRFQQILMNLLGNALKFTETGEVTVRVEGDRLQDDRWELRIAVQDTGIGIASDRLAGLFEPFYQADSSITRRFGGSGLGLAICQRLCEKMQGSIAVESELGVGSTFRVRLQLPAAPPTPTIGSDNPRTWPLQGRPLRILVAEDNRTNQRLISLVLKRLGHTADLVEDGTAAVLAWQQQPYDAILMDVRMPNVDGLTATRQIRHQDQRPQPWIIGLSGDALTETREAALAAGMDDYLIKPLDIRKLESVLQKIVGGRGQRLQ